MTHHQNSKQPSGTKDLGHTSPRSWIMQPLPSPRENLQLSRLPETLPGWKGRQFLLQPEPGNPEIALIRSIHVRAHPVKHPLRLVLPAQRSTNSIPPTHTMHGGELSAARSEQKVFLMMARLNCPGVPE